MKRQWFDVDADGIRKVFEQHGWGPAGEFTLRLPRLVGELLQNALDENVTTVSIRLTLQPGRPMAELSVEDDSPDGFKNLAHAYTLFAESYKKHEPEKRGRLNFGEKAFLAMCRSATISTTTGTVIFDDNSQR